MESLDNLLKQAFTLHRDGRWDAAEEAYQQALLFSPDHADIYFNIGLIHLATSNFQKACAAFERVILLTPSNPKAYFHLGESQQSAGNVSQAIASYRHAIELWPEFAESHHNLGDSLQNLGDFQGACDAYFKAISIRPHFFSAYNNLATSLIRLGRNREAISALENAIRINPAFALAYNNLGSAYKEDGQLQQSESAFRKAIELSPGYAEAHANLGNLYLDRGLLQPAIGEYRNALISNPHFFQAASILVSQLQQVCDWQGIDNLAQRLIDCVDRDESQHGIAPFPFIGLLIPTSHPQQLKCAKRWSQYYDSRQTSPITPMMENANKDTQEIVWPRSTVKSRLKIGYISADFRIHAVAFMVPELFEEHDRMQFEIFGYSICKDDGSTVRARIEKSFDRFRQIESLDFGAAAKVIEDDQIDILVDLQGYTTYSRTEILALRPSPIQVSYMGFPGTMGATFIDYVLADNYVLPMDQQEFYTEKIVHLPGCYQVNDSKHEIASSTPTRIECELPEDGFIFCSFNNSYKITPSMMDTWMRLLNAIPRSVLWISEHYPLTIENLRREASKRGIDSSRLVFAKRLPIDRHLARHRLADLFLDSFPYNAHATASIALRMGVPMVTLSGKTFASRVAGSLLRELGCERWIANTLSEYESKALQLATDKTSLDDYRSLLRDNIVRSKLFDGKHFARKLEKAFIAMWQIYKAGNLPRPIVVGNNDDCSQTAFTV